MLRKPATFLFGVLLGCTSAAAQVIAIKAGRLIDPDTGTALADTIILIRANKIEAVGRGLAIPPGESNIALPPDTFLPS